MMPAWVNEPARSNDYSNYQGEDERPPSNAAAAAGRSADAMSRARAATDRARWRDGREQREGGQRPEQIAAARWAPARTPR